MEIKNFNWHCPFCQHNSVIEDGKNASINRHHFDFNNIDGQQTLYSVVIVCPNLECRQVQIDAVLYSSQRLSTSFGVTFKDIAEKARWRIAPKFSGRIYPAYIPDPIREDYMEACQIVDDSPKASATLARRCLQGMVRDFWQISRKTLNDELQEIQSKVDQDVWEAIDSLRSIGNIGAHMERDINVIVDVDPDEARQLIGLIELLLDEWYVARHDRQARLASIKAVADSKKQAKLAPPTTTSGP